MGKSSLASVFDRTTLGSMYQDRKSEFYEVGNQASSSLPLQMALYFNVWLFPVWLLVVAVNLDAKYYNLTDIYKILTTAVLLVISISEVIRLYLGYLGNLAGKIPELACFWLMSSLIQFPLEAFLLFDSGTLPSFSEVLFDSFMIGLLAIEIVTGTLALKSLADCRAKRFYLSQLYGVDDKLNER